MWNSMWYEITYNKQTQEHEVHSFVPGTYWGGKYSTIFRNFVASGSAKYCQSVVAKIERIEQ